MLEKDIVFAYVRDILDDVLGTGEKSLRAILVPRIGRRVANSDSEHCSRRQRMALSSG